MRSGIPKKDVCTDVIVGYCAVVKNAKVILMIEVRSNTNIAINNSLSLSMFLTLSGDYNSFEFSTTDDAT